MNKYLKSFLFRGAIFGGFGPIVASIVYLILELSLDNFSLSGSEVFWAVVSTYLLAFIHAGVSVFNQIESWSVPKSMLAHFSSLYAVYTLCYLVNSWLPFDIFVFLSYTAIFVLVYLVIWLSVYLSVRKFTKKANSML